MLAEVVMSEQGIPKMSIIIIKYSRYTGYSVYSYT